MKTIALNAALLIVLLMGAGRAEAQFLQSTSSSVSGPPVAVLEELQSRGCKLPGKRSKDVIINGEFFKPGQSDWAAVCSAKKSTSLLAFPAGSRERVQVLQMTPGRSSRWSISVMNQEELNSIKSALGWNKREPTEINHQGIILFVVVGDKDVGCLYCYSAEGTAYYYQDDWLKVVTLMVN